MEKNEVCYGWILINLIHQFNLGVEDTRKEIFHLYFNEPLSKEEIDTVERFIEELGEDDPVLLCAKEESQIEAIKDALVRRDTSGLINDFEDYLGGEITDKEKLVEVMGDEFSLLEKVRPAIALFAVRRYIDEHFDVDGNPL